VTVNPIALTLITLALALCGVYAGRFLRGRLREGDLSSDTKDFVKVVVAFMTTMAALLLSLQLSSSKTSFDAQELQVVEVSSQVLFLDRALAHSGPGAATARATLHDVVAGMVQRSWPVAFRGGARLQTPPGAYALYDNINKVKPVNGSQQFAKARALETAVVVGKSLRLISQEGSSSTTLPLLSVEISWITVIFIFFGLLSPSNRTALTALVLSAFVVASAIFLIAEMSSPFTGIIRISAAPLQEALTQIGQ
jgi:hypothetical protein